MPIALFKNQHDYQQFRIWIIEGSTLAQRMQSAWGAVETPANWLEAKQYLDEHGIAPMSLPRQLDFHE